jgi:putative flippase GtrA
MIEWLRKLGKRPFVRFLIVGSLNTILTYALFLLLGSVLHYSLAYTISYLAGIAFSYVLAATYVFDTGVAVRSALRFPFVYVLQYLYGLAALYALVDLLGVWQQVAILFVIGTSVPLTFVLMRQAMRSGGTVSPLDVRQDVIGAD